MNLGMEELNKLEQIDYISSDELLRDDEFADARIPIFYKDNRKRVHLIYGVKIMADGTRRLIGWIALG